MTKPSPQNNAHPKLILEVTGIFLLVILFTVFFTTTFLNSPVPRWAVLLSPTLNPNFVNEIWFGVDLPNKPYSGERITTFTLGAFIIFAAFCLGNIIYKFFPKEFRTSKLETVFLSTSVGMILFPTLMFYVGYAGYADMNILHSLLSLVIIWTILRIISALHHKKVSSVPNVPNNISVSTKIKSLIQTHYPYKYDKIIVFIMLFLICLFSSFYLFSATQPIFEYDAVEYHLQGAREFYESGSITFAPHNAYMNMPLGAEMFYLIGFDLVRDLKFSSQDVLRFGSLVGKTALTGFVYLTILGLFLFCRQFFNNRTAGGWAAFAFLSFPGVFEVYYSGLNDCVLSFCILGIFYIFYRRIKDSATQSGFTTNICYALLLGLFVGFAIAVKYTSVVFILIPTVVAVLFVEFRHNSVNHLQKSNKLQITITVLCVFAITAILTGGGWYLRNALATGNPVYPLGYGFFGDSTGLWNHAIDKRWSRVHSPSTYGINALLDSLTSSLWRDGLCSPFYAIVALVGTFITVKTHFKTTSSTERFNPQFLRNLFITIVVYWIAWFMLTHRLTRFLLPIAPMAALFFGFITYKVFTVKSLGVKILVLLPLLMGTLYSGLTIDMIGQGRMAPLQALEEDPYRFPKESIYFAHHPELFKKQGKEQKLLLIGEAKAFMYRVPILYSTCWNDSPLVNILVDAVEKNVDGKITAITDVNKLRENFERHNIAYILVDFAELARFRSEGNYGFNNPEITEELFQLLLNASIIEPFEFDQEFIKNKKGSSNSIKVFKITNNS